MSNNLHSLCLQSIAEDRWRTGFQLFEHKAEILGVGKTGHGGDFLNTQSGVDQKVCCMINTQNLQIFNGCGLIYLMEIAAELRIRQIGNAAQRGNRHICIGEMLVHIIQRVLDGQESGGMIDRRTLFIQLGQNGIEHGHAFVVIARPLQGPGLIDRLEVIPENRGVLGDKGLWFQIFLVGDVQVDAQNNFLLGFDVIRVARGNKQNRMYANLHIPIRPLNQRTAVNPEGKGAVLPGGDNAVLGGQMKLDYG